jgi:hypothetical protein
MKKNISTKEVIRFTSVLEKSNNKLWGCHFSVPNTIVKRLAGKDSRRVVCMLNDTIEYQCAMLPHGSGTFVITVNKKIRDTLKLDFGDKVQVSLKKDESKYGLPLPEELKELFRQDKEGSKLFHALTKGKQRTLLYIIGKVKDPEKRVTQAITIVRHLKTNNGTINYRQLSGALKDPRRRLLV